MTGADVGSPHPGGPEAARITDRVAELLGVDCADIDPEDDLIAQGLDSIRMMTLAGQWRRAGFDIDFARLAAAPSVRAWAELLTPADRPDPAPAHAQPADGEPFAMAPMQHAMWIGRHADQQLGGVAGHLYVEFDGSVTDPDRFRRAATQLAARHPMLRVQFLPDGTQRIGPAPDPFPVAVTDLRGADDVAVGQHLAAVRTAKSRQQLSGQVLELTLTLLPRDRTRLHVDLDMQAADAMSYRALMTDLAALYGGDPLTDIGYTYQQYRQHVSQPDSFEDDRQWWAERVPELPDAPALPLRPVAQRTDPHRPGRRWHWLDPATRDGLFARARRRGVTPAMTLAASFADTVAGWSADPRFLLNVPLFGREPLHPDVEKVVGDFTSSLLLDIDLAAANTPAQRARSVQQSMHEAAAHASYPGLSVLRDLSRHRGTQVLAPVVFTSALGLGELFSPEVTTQFGSPEWIISQGPQVLLDAQVTEFGGGILLNWDVREDAFCPGVIDAMFARHIDEVRHLAHDDEGWDAPRETLLPALQRKAREAVTTTAPPSGRMLHDGFFAAAARQPDAPAAFSGMGDLTYGELRRQALAVAAALRAAGLPDGGTVAVLGPKTAEQVPALLGIHAAGGVYLPIGADQPAERAQRIIAGAAVDIALVCGTELPDVAVPAMTVADAVARGDGIESSSVTGDPNRLAYVLFTSGSTGEPKGVEVTHDAAMNTVEFITEHFGLGPDDRCLALSTLECDISVLDIFATLATGGAIVVVGEEHRRDPDQWVRLIEAHQVTVLHFLPGWLAMLLEVAGPLPTVRVVPTGGDWVTPAMARQLRDRAPEVRFAGLGGATETAIHNTVCEVVDVPADWTAIPFGKPLPNNRCRVVSATGDDCPDWVPGELWIGGRGIARGYRGRPDLTAERFVDHDGITWYRTGDLARFWPDGTCEFVGRADNRVKISGYRVELGEVEAALQRLPGVLGAVAVTLPARTGAQDWLAASVVLAADSPPVDELRHQLGKVIPPHMVPQHVEVLDHIPYTVGGKVDRQAVARQLADHAESAAVYRPAAGPLQSALTAIVAGLLGAPRLGVDDDFFSQGGDSVLATTAVARIRQWLDVSGVSVADIFATRTVEGLANRLRELEPADRLDEIAELYLEVTDMDSAEVAMALTTAGDAAQRMPG
ncbi:mycobactin phenyloxazoline synthetase [Mycolicibacterium sp. BK556]|uniref:non-ribosomal peptide synthetase n=1 Tax=unclassified Mycolicibacterium TaxID=2636767 RepID=UPI0016144B34|nr:mycobactin phenyloxazoline synthetase [Mycolicibacterium sp. BK556]MBB3630257.1 mycobactin phenyloxazoline synthetase [Mycolicibacterium sp. BK607]MBB3748257.1 mycobactin phenyloxazoline synthetase [Mycolicibacterium sp. BK634]